MGRTQCFRANVAYSLYGVKTGKNAPSSISACSSPYYINSFFTTAGIESFGDNVGIDYEDAGASSECDNEEGDDDDNEDNNNNGDDHGNNEMLYENYLSYGTGCSSSGNFIQAQFQGAYCDGNHFLAATDDFEDLNEAFEELGCLQVYGFVSSDDEDGDNEGDDNDDNAAYNLLSYSAACSHTEYPERYPERCPDPHGYKKKRDANLYNYSKAHFRAVPLVMPILSSLLIVGALILLYLSYQIQNQSIKKKGLNDPIDGARGEGQPSTFMSHVSESFSRTATGLSERTRTFREQLQDYAEEEDDIEEPEKDAPGDYQSPEPISEKVGEDPVIVSNEEVADAMLADQGITPPPKTVVEEKKKYKRPRLAKISKFFFGRRKNKKNKNQAAL
jgi:hypothetical protein